MKNRAMRFIQVTRARHTLSLPPSLATGRSIGADVATVEPAVIGAIMIRTEESRGIDRTLAAPREDHHRRGRPGGMTTGIDP